MNKWVAIYLAGKNEEDHVFQTEEDAWNYVFSRMCKNCQEERQKALELGVNNSDDVESPMEFPACSAEWLVMKKSKFDECSSLAEIFQAVGMKRVEK